ncbi:MAG: hypothetical protein ACO316_03705 [Candidatus Nanopelagicales bacterium]
MRINLVLNFLSRIILIFSLVFTFLFFQNINSNASVNCDVYTQSDLVNAFGDHLTSAQINACTTITLKNDITLTSTWTSVGQIAISYFTGTIEGNGFTITGLTADRGLIAAADTATIRNINIRSCTVNNAAASTVGGLISYATDGTEISNSSTDCAVTGASQVGGLIGKADSNSIIRNSFSVGVVNCDNTCGGFVGWSVLADIKDSYSTGAVNGQYNVGGLVGLAQGTSFLKTYATGNVSKLSGGLIQSFGGLIGSVGASGSTNSFISQSYATGDVSASDGNYVAGLVGQISGETSSNRMSIENVYSSGNVTGSSQVGGLFGEIYNSNINNSYQSGTVTYSGGAAGALVGQTDGTITFSNTYWNSTVNSTLPTIYGTDKLSDELKNISTFSSWSIESVCSVPTNSIWAICSSSNNGYPFLMFTLGSVTTSENVWMGSANITCPEANPWINEKNEIAYKVKPLTSLEDNLIGKFILEDKLIELGKDGIFFDAKSEIVDATTYVLPDFGCSDRWLEYKLNKPIQFIVGGFTLQSNAQGFIKVPNGNWHDLSFTTLYTDTAAFLHTIQFSQKGQYLLVITEQPDLTAGLLPTYGFKTVRFLVDIKN